jgi:hypothetical protein
MLVLVPATLVAQRPWNLRLELDNDAYNFWRMPGNRPDEEYTNGVRIVLERPGVSWWAHPFVRARNACTAGARCTTARTTLGQDIYTPRNDRQPRDVDDWELERPYAGWLYLRYETEVARPRSLTTLSLALGTTGKPSLAQLSQRIAHQLTKFTEEVHGWDTQIGFEPGAILSYRQSWLAASSSTFDFTPFVGASAGNILTNADVGAKVRIGHGLSHPWRHTGASSRPEWFISLGAREEGVARNISLDGNTFHRTRFVERTPFVTEYEAGVTIRVRGIAVGYRAVTRTREYRTGPSSHSYGSMTAEVDFRR